MRFLLEGEGGVVGGGGAMCCCLTTLMHMCMHARLGKHALPLCMCLCVCVYVCVYMCVYFVEGVLVGWDGGVSHGTALCLSHLPPHSTDTQGNGRRGAEGGINFGKKESGSSGLMGNNAGFTDGPKARHTGWVWKPIYQSI